MDTYPQAAVEKTEKVKLFRRSLALWRYGSFFVLLTLSIAAMVTPQHSISFHQWIGAALFTAFILHLSQHHNWITATIRRFPGRLPFTVQLKAILDLLLLIDFVLLCFSGVVISLIYAPHVVTFHKTTQTLFCGLVVFHLFLNRKWITSIVQAFKPQM